jgi:sterol desaturase/sphingolipid hydroxylase (fatty acid hydroxylase superfamily)
VLKAKLNPIPNPVRGLIVGGWIVTLLWLERRRALRRNVDSKIVRDIRNLAIAAGAGMVMQGLEAPVAFRLARAAEVKRRGVVQRLPFPPIVRGLISIVLLDYTLYLWHVLTHRVPFLWRFHQVHHGDREMDASTALRFHFGEIAISVIFRIGQVVFIGPSRMSFALWQMFLMICILFHHSNVRLRIAFERRLARLVITPRLHGIHHSIAIDQMNANWSSGLTVWDWLHRTLLTEVPQQDIVIGVANRSSDADQELAQLLALPFKEDAPVADLPNSPGRQSISAIAE